MNVKVVDSGNPEQVIKAVLEACKRQVAAVEEWAAQKQRTLALAERAIEMGATRAELTGLLSGGGFVFSQPRATNDRFEQSVVEVEIGNPPCGVSGLTTPRTQRDGHYP